MVWWEDGHIFSFYFASKKFAFPKLFIAVFCMSYNHLWRRWHANLNAGKVNCLWLWVVPSWRNTCFRFLFLWFHAAFDFIRRIFAVNRYFSSYLVGFVGVLALFGIAYVPVKRRLVERSKAMITCTVVISTFRLDFTPFIIIIIIYNIFTQLMKFNVWIQSNWKWSSRSTGKRLCFVDTFYVFIPSGVQT